jgi:hypothetical protein
MGHLRLQQIYIWHQIGRLLRFNTKRLEDDLRLCGSFHSHLESSISFTLNFSYFLSLDSLYFLLEFVSLLFLRGHCFFFALLMQMLLVPFEVNNSSL